MDKKELVVDILIHFYEQYEFAKPEDLPEITANTAETICLILSPETISESFLTAGIC